jgi:cell division protein FtsZ
MGDTIKVTVIATGFGDSFEVGKGRVLGRKPFPITDTPTIVRNPLDRPTFQRDREKIDNVTRIRPTVSFIEEDEDQYDIPTFLRKSVD